jgi:uncharacterized protein YigA (DUF484 family)
MSSIPKIDDALRAALISEPGVILDDSDLMRALIAANENSIGENILDLRGIAMARLENRLDQLEDTHRNVIANAYENLAGTNQIQRAILRMLDPIEFETFLKDLSGEVADILRVDVMRLLLETVQDEDDPAIARLSDILSVAAPGFVDEYITEGRNAVARQVTLRTLENAPSDIYGDTSETIRSEACLKLDFGAGRLPGLLLMGSKDPDMFSPEKGTELLSFFANVFERTMRRWLS